MSKLDNLPEEAKEHILGFVENSNLQRMSQTIRILFFAYLRNSHDGLSVDFDNILYDVETIIGLFEDLSDTMSLKKPKGV